MREPLFTVGTLEAAPLDLEDAEALRELFAACDGNEDLACGLPAHTPDDPWAQASLARGETYSIGLFEGEDTAGVIDLVRDAPTPGAWTIGLLMVETGKRGWTLGHEVLTGLAAWARDQGACRLVVAAPEALEPFWLEAGFEPVALDEEPNAVMPGFVSLGRELRDR